MQSVCDAFGNEDVFISNLIYPEEHGLIKNIILYYLSGRQINTPELMKMELFMTMVGSKLFWGYDNKIA